MEKKFKIGIALLLYERKHMSFFYMQICVTSVKIVFSFIHEKKFYRKTPINKNFKKLNFKWLIPFHVLEQQKSTL